MRNGSPTLSSLTRTVAMLEAMIDDVGKSSVSDIARRAGMPRATAHRQVASLVAEGLLVPVGHGRYAAGDRLRKLAHRIDDKQVVTMVAAPLLSSLAARARCIAQLGTLEGDMVTYRIKTGRGAGNLFTKVGMQLEAYCSGIGKALLAHLPPDEQERYLATGPFVALTERTITSPAALRAEFEDIRTRGFARDDGEIAAGLLCHAVPIRRRGKEMGGSEVVAAISMSQAAQSERGMPSAEIVAMLMDAAREIEAAAFGPEPD